MNTLFIIVGVIFLASLLIGYKKGFVKIAASLIATLLCSVLVSFISPSVSQWIQEHTSLRENVQDKCVELFFSDGTISEEFLQMEVTREQERSLLEGAKLPKILREKLWVDNNSVMYDALGVETYAQYIGTYLTKIVADILAFLITFIVVFIVVRIMIGLLKIVDKIPLVGGANRTVGALLGAGVGVVIIWILFIIITVLYNTAFGVTCLDSIAENEILTWLYDNNLLMNSVMKF